MKSNEKKIILILLIITIILSIIFIKNKKTDSEYQERQQETQIGEYVQQLEDGTKQCTSEKLNETKNIGDIEITGIQIIENDGTARLTANVKNNSSTTKNEFPLTIKLLNESGEVIETLGAYVGTIKSGETRGIDASINMDILDVYDVSIEL